MFINHKCFHMRSPRTPHQRLHQPAFLCRRRKVSRAERGNVQEGGRYTRWEGCHESRTCSKNTCPDSYGTEYTSIRRIWCGARCCISLSHSPSLSLSHTHTQSHTLTHSHSHPLAHSLSHTHTLSLTHANHGNFGNLIRTSIPEEYDLMTS